jgi:hypothetical protein
MRDHSRPGDGERLAFGPPRRWGRWEPIAGSLLILALLNAILSLILYSIGGDAATHAFPLIAGIKAQPLHTDLRWLTTISECDLSQGPWINERGIICAQAAPGGLIGYPPMSVQVARWLAVRVSHTALLGLSLGLATIVVLTSFSLRVIQPPIQRHLIAALVLLSFPVQLALERGNIDMVVLLLIASLAATLAVPGVRLWPLQGSLAWLLVAIKAYPLAGLMAWSVCQGVERRRLVSAAAVASGASIGLVMILPWLRQSGNAVAGKAPGLSSHGFAELGLQLGPPSAAGLLEFILLNKWGLLLVIAGFLLGRKQRLRAHLLQITQAAAMGYSQRFLAIFVPLSTFIWLGCYFLSTSIDYRFILAMPAVVIVYSLLAQRLRSHGFLSSAGLVLSALTITLLNPIPGIFIGANAATVALAVAIDRFSDSIVLPLLAGSLLAMVAPAFPPLHRVIPDRATATSRNRSGP